MRAELGTPVCFAGRVPVLGPSWKACWEHVVSGRPAADVAAELGGLLD
jgi:hypothetical protein